MDRFFMATTSTLLIVTTLSLALWSWTFLRS